MIWNLLKTANGKRQRRYRSFEYIELNPENPTGFRSGILKDISPKGARITAFDLADLPKHVDLSVPGMNIRVRGRIRWRHQNDVGIRFSKSVDVSELAMADRAKRTANAR